MVGRNVYNRKKLISSPDISISIDLFSMGILLFRPGFGSSISGSDLTGFFFFVHINN
jgi:hypothetical protein